MTTSFAPPIEQTARPTTTSEVAGAIKECYEASRAVYPIGGGTTLDNGLRAHREGWGLAMGSMQQVVDYPARDMTITVEAGITAGALAEVMKSAGQRLPIDVADADRATLGAVVATNQCGPRRFGWGTVRDYVIGIEAVDGRGVVFHGGGRVVKNVAGYDLCKLLTGSMGTLAVITQLTLKVMPSPQAAAFVAGAARDAAQVEQVLAALRTSRTVPVAVEMLAGPHWGDVVGLESESDAPFRLVVGFEGTTEEVDWQVAKLLEEWTAQDVVQPHLVDGAAGAALWDEFTAFGAREGAPAVLRARVTPRAVTPLTLALLRDDPQASILAHALSGDVLVRLSRFTAEDVSRLLIARWQVAAIEGEGNLVVLASDIELTPQAVWGHRPEAFPLMQKVKRCFDPKGILNPDRFIF